MLATLLAYQLSVAHFNPMLVVSVSAARTGYQKTNLSRAANCWSDLLQGLTVPAVSCYDMLPFAAPALLLRLPTFNG